MELKYESTTIVKPEKILRKEVPLSIFDKAASDMRVDVLLVFKTGSTCNTKIKDALSKVLSHYPMLVGKLSGGQSPTVFLDDESGVPVTETAVSGCLENFLPFELSPALAVLRPTTHGTNPLFLVQLNRFDCGGLVIGVSSSHKVADGHSMSNFFISWSEMVRDQSLRVLPVHDKSLFSPRDPPKPEFPHEETEFCSMRTPDGAPATVQEQPIENLVVHYSSEFIRKLRERVGSKHSTFECMLAHVWKKATIARGLARDEVTRARISVNGRSRLDITPAYFGNLVLTAIPAAKVNDLVREDLGYTAQLIKEAVGQMGRDYFQSFIDFGSLNKDKELYPSASEEGNTLSPDLVIYSWLGFQFHQVDMGGGAVQAFVPSWIPLEGIAIIAPAPVKDKGQESEKWGGGIDVIICLSKEHAKTFKQMAYSID